MWVIGYGFVQSFAPGLLRRRWHGQAPQGKALIEWSAILAIVTGIIAVIPEPGTFWLVALALAFAVARRRR